MGLFSKKIEPAKDIRLNEIYTNLKNSYPEVSSERKEELSKLINKYGYLPYPYIKALEELSAEEILFGLEIKWENNGSRTKRYLSGKIQRALICLLLWLPSCVQQL